MGDLLTQVWEKLLFMYLFVRDCGSVRVVLLARSARVLDY